MAAIVLDGDASGAVRAAGLAERAMRRVAGAVDDLDKKHKASAFSGRNLAERLTDIDKAAQIVGGPLASLTPTLNDMGDAIEQVGLRQAALNVGAAALASGGLAALIAGATAAIGVMAGLGANAVAVASDLASFDAILGANSSTMQRNRADLVALSDAQSDLALSTAAARVELAGLAAPVMTELTYAAAGVAGAMQTMARDEVGAFSAMEDLTKATIAFVPGLNLLAAQAWLGSYALGAMADSGRDNAAALREQAASAAAYLVVAPELAAEADSIEASWSSLPFDMVADSMDRVRASVLATTPTVRANRTEARESAEDYSFLADSAREAATAVAAASQLRADQATVAGLPSAVSSSTFGVGPNERQAMADAEAASAAESARLQVEASDAMRERVTSNLSAIGGAAIDLSSTVADAMAQAFEQGGDRSEKARKKQFAAMKAVALLQAGINTALAISNVWASWASVPPVAAALTAIAAGVGAAQIGMIAAKSYHRGGLLPDETMLGESRVRKNETHAVITAQGMNALGGSNGLARVNAGMAPPEPGPIVLVVGGRTQRTRPFAGAEPGYGHRARGR